MEKETGPRARQRSSAPRPRGLIHRWTRGTPPPKQDVSGNVTSHGYWQQEVITKHLNVGFRPRIDHIKTGTNAEFRFSPRSVDAFGSTVIAEGSADAAGQLYWVHAWTVGPDGVITQLREYFNTDLTVTRLSATKNAGTSSPGHSSSSSTSSSPSSSTSSGLSSPEHTPKWPKCLWQSRRTDRARKSLPGLVLAI